MLKDSQEYTKFQKILHSDVEPVIDDMFKEILRVDETMAPSSRDKIHTVN